MAHGVQEQTPSKPEIEKASILQALAVKEEEEVHLLREAQEKARKEVADAHAASVQRAKELEIELKNLEKEILEKETAQGEKEAAQIRGAGAKELESKHKLWQSRVAAAAEKLYQRIVKV